MPSVILPTDAILLAAEETAAANESYVTLYHQGNLENGVSASQPLSTSLSSDLTHYDPEGQLYQFNVPQSTFDQWYLQGNIETFNDLHAPSGIITPEIRISPPTSGQMPIFSYTTAMRNGFVPKKIFCCSGFQHRVEAAGQRGLAVLVHKTSSGLMFLFQSRGIAFDDVKKIRQDPTAPDMKINVSFETGLQYCPWCGRRLHELIEVSPNEYEELAEKHTAFYTGP